MIIMSGSDDRFTFVEIFRWIIPAGSRLIMSTSP